MTISQELAQETEQTYDLFVSYIEGKSEREQEVFARLRRRVLFLARMGLGGWLRQRETSEDIAQESMIQLHKSLATASFDHPKRFAAYLASVVQHVISSRVRHHQVDVRDPKYHEPIARSRTTLSTTEFRIELASCDQSPIDTLLQDESSSGTLMALEECLGELSPDQREVFVNLRLLELPSTEAARLMGREPNAAFYELYRRARTQLAMKMVLRGFGEEQ
jgi:RNA polymerase sigma factor (sigma-70 family)